MGHAMTERATTYGVSDGVLRRLSEWNEANPEARVLSLYVGFDGGDLSTADARTTLLNSLVSEAREQAGEDDGVCVERVAERLAAIDELQSVAGLAVFCAEEPSLFELLHLPQPVDAQVSVGSLNLRPLLDVQRGDTWCVLLVNRSNARIFLGSEHTLREFSQVEDDVKNQHKKGGWSQARFQRSVAKDVSEHVDHAQDEVLGFWRRHQFDHLLVGAPDALRGEIERDLHPYLAERLRGFVSIDVDRASADDVAAAAGPPMVEHRESRELEAVERFRANHGRGALAASGLPACLDALSSMRVETLLVASTLAASGVSCPACTYIAAGGDACPLDGAALVPEDDIVSKAVELALMQSATVSNLSQEDLLADHGGIAAILRF